MTEIKNFVILQLINISTTMELIKTPSFNAMENLADVLSQNNKNFSSDYIYQKLGKYLVSSGSKNFVELYNDVAKNKNYKQAFITLNL
jgi:hypothetical protein